MQELKQIKTYFAPAGRLSAEALQEQMNLTLADPIIKVVLEAVNGYALILNEQRQVLAANQELIDALSISSCDNIAGLRPGEILECVHVNEGPDGCGTSPFCHNCGAVITILSCQQSRTVVEGECRMNTFKEGHFKAADYKVRATPIQLDEHELTVFVFQDISANKRREVLEEVFLHDILNMVGGIKGWSEQLQSSAPELAAKQLMTLAGLLKEEVQFHSLLARAEKNELEVVFRRTEAAEIFEHLKQVFTVQMVDEKKTIEFSPVVKEDYFSTDRSLLLRVLINMVKNALEATPKNGVVGVNFEWVDHTPVFRVHNVGFISRQNQDHVYERSFTTKGNGRGIGTYSIKLFGEQYLKGKVSFTSSPESGTTFMIELPRQAPTLKRGNQKEIKGSGGNMNSQIQKVLLVDDDESQSLLERLLLERLGFQVKVCTTGEEALSLFGSAPLDYAFVMTDYTMIPMDGLEMARKMLQIHSQACVLLCTGRDDVELTQLAKQAGVRAVALKPVNREEMVDLLESAGLITLD